MNVSGQVYIPPPFSPCGKNPLFTLNKGLVGAHSRSRSFGEDKFCSPVETPTTKPRYRRKCWGLRRLQWISDL